MYIWQRAILYGIVEIGEIEKGCLNRKKGKIHISNLRHILMQEYIHNIFLQQNMNSRVNFERVTELAEELEKGHI